MLSEYNVVVAVAEYLQDQDYEVTQKLRESQKGDDIIAVSPARNFRLLIEAKGESSSKSSSARYGKPFNQNQVKVHVAAAFYRSAQMLQKPSDLPVKAAIALPCNQAHLEAVESIQCSLHNLGIGVFWVNKNGSVIYKS